MEDRTKKFYLNPWISLVTLAIVIGIRIWDPSFVESVRLRYFDTLVTGKDKTDVPVHTVNIDEAALEKYGQWPFPRNMYAEIINDLYKREAGLVVFNVLMPEADRQGGDSVLAETLKNHPTVLSNIPSSVNKNTPRPNGAAIVNSNFIDRIYNYPGVIANIPELENSAVGVGTTNVYPEIGDIVLWNNLYFEVDNVNENQLVVGKDPSYPYSEDVVEFGDSLSFILTCHMTRPEIPGIEQTRL